MALIVNMVQKQELGQKDQRIKKQITMHKALHPIDDIDYTSRKEGKGLVSTEDFITTSIQGIVEYVKNLPSRLGLHNTPTASLQRSKTPPQRVSQI